MKHFLVRKELSIVLLFSPGGLFVLECKANVRLLFACFYGIFVKTTRNRIFFAQNCDFFVILNTSLPFWCKILSEGQLSIFAQFWKIFMSTP